MSTKKEVQQERSVDSLGFVRKSVKASKAVMSSVESVSLAAALAAEGLISLAAGYSIQTEKTAAKDVNMSVEAFQNEKARRIEQLLN